MDRRCEVLDWARATGGLVLEDDYDGEFRYDVSPLPALRSMPGAAEHVVYLGTASKVLSPSLRLAWAVVPDRLRDDVERRVRAHGLAVDVVGARALAELVSSGPWPGTWRGRRGTTRASRSAQPRSASRVEPLSAYATDDDRSGLVIGYGGLPRGQADEVVRLVSEAVRTPPRPASVSPTRNPPRVSRTRLTLALEEPR